MGHGDGGTLNANSDTYGQVGGMPPPPPIPSDTPPAVRTWIEAAAATLFGAANLGDPEDNEKAQKGHAEREAMATDAAGRFPAGDEQQAMGMDQMAQQLPQMLSSASGAITGGLGGALQPFMQIPQQFAQAAQQLLQSGMGAFQKGGEGLGADALAGDFEPLAGGGGGGLGDVGAGGGGSGGGGAGTTPMAMLGPPATPSSSTSTAPTAGRVMSAPPASAATAAHPATPMGGMGGMPMMPHGMGAGSAGGKDNKAATKRISVPSIKNGAPVQGRVTAPPTAPTVHKNVDEAKRRSTRRVVIPSDKTERAEIFRTSGLISDMTGWPRRRRGIHQITQGLGTLDREVFDAIAESPTPLLDTVMPPH